MKIELINQPRANWDTLHQILFNRGIDQVDMQHYINLTDDDICNNTLLGEELLKQGLRALGTIIQQNKTAFLIVDCDCDGYTSAALFINYLHKLFPTWVETRLTWWMHDSKQHGLADCVSEAENYDMVICIDSSSNDYEQHKYLHDKGINVLILDHHLADVDVHNYTDAIIINNQLSCYPNKELCGCGVAWQFCRYIDQLSGTTYANDLLDLVAIANIGDMMDLRSCETKYLISQGLRKENIKNPFIEYMMDKNAFPLSKAEYVSADPQMACTPMGAAFFIVPFINAITRSGTLDEKKLIFRSMLEHEAYTQIPEIKRNKPTGKTELLVLQAVRVIGNVKNRQTRAETNGLEMLERMIQTNHMLDHRILLFILEPNQIEPEIRGLIANKFMAKYQRPCIITTINGDECVGSGRGYTKNGLLSFKNLLEQCPGVNWVQGHDNAHGISLQTNKINEFLQSVDDKMSKISVDPIYRVDYYFTDFDEAEQRIIDIANLNDYWGQDFDRALVGIKFKIESKNVSVMKANTLKITLSNKLSLIIFNASDEDIDKFTIASGWKEFEAVGKCNINSWNDIDYAQIMITDYELIDSCKYVF